MDKFRPLTLRLLAGIIAATALLSACSQQQASTKPKFTRAMRIPQTTLDHWRKTLDNQGVKLQQYGWSTRLIIPADRLFVPGSNALTADARTLLKTISRILKQITKNTDQAYPIRIVSHTDNIYSHQHSHYLGHQYSQVIASFMWRHGIARKHIRVLSAGNTQAVANTRSMIGKYKNRRIEIMVH